MEIKILIAGVGQLGSRYLQGLFKTSFDLEIWVYDISLDSLQRAESRFNELGISNNKVNYICSLDLVPSTIEIAIVTSTADVRVNLVNDITRKIEVKYWILEKVLAQSLADLITINELLINSKGVWVNTPMYLMPLYFELRKRYAESANPIIAKFSGFKGLASNSVHYIDFVSRWNNSEIINYDISSLEKKWVESKRSHFYEINGMLKFEFNDGSELILIGNQTSQSVFFEIQIGEEAWIIDESKAFAQSSLGDKINAPVLLQSQITSDLIEEIIVNQKCNLPSLVQSTFQHTILIKALLEHWNKYSISKTLTLPIT
jgi:hypothetical protein